MNAQNIQRLLESNRELLKRSLPSFEKSLTKCRQIALSLDLSFEEEEYFDSLTSKFSRVSDIYTQKGLKSLTFLLREEAVTFIDRMNLCEKLDVIQSAEDMISIRDLRNLIAHEYLTENLVDVYQETLRLSEKLLGAISQTDRFIDRQISENQNI